MANLENDIQTTLGPDAHFKGELKFEKGVRLLGQFDGQIESKGQLLVAEGATLTGEVQAGTINVDGEVKGNLSADAKIQLTSSGHLEGDICATRLEVADGAVLIGRCTIGNKGSAQPKPKSTPTLTPSPKLSETLVPKITNPSLVKTPAR